MGSGLGSPLAVAIPSPLWSVEQYITLGKLQGVEAVDLHAKPNKISDERERWPLAPMVLFTASKCLSASPQLFSARQQALPMERKPPMEKLRLLWIILRTRWGKGIDGGRSER